ncbi:MAG: enoyl-CoA hydratase/isomerase family protein [Deltaproteobacteria bacterium]|nr:enoyl-CoA hydratase/isomerase family protein [Deltaproteobacteria bacterium]
MATKTVGIVGVGNMGAGIAQKIAMEGFAVRVADMNGERARAGRQTISDSLDEAVARRVLSEVEAKAALERVTAVESLEGLAECDLVIEVIFENLLVKKELFRNLDSICKPGCVLATNTSSFYVHELASVTRRPGEVVGLHYFFHPAKNRLLEVIPGPLTRPEVTAEMVRFAEAHSKTALVCKDAPGFVVNRFFVPWLNESVRLLEEGVANIPTIEAAAKQAFGIGMGPFLLMNVTGVPISLHAASTLGTELGPFYEPCERLRHQVEDLKADWTLDDGELDPSAFQAVADRLLGVTFAVAGAIVDEGVCSLEDVDRGARIGLRWSQGPFELANREGVERALALVHALEAVHPDLSIPDTITGQAGRGEPFAFSRVDLGVKDGIARLTINRPEVMNALDPELVGQMKDRFEEAQRLPGLKGIVLAGTGKAFVAGADVSFFVRRIEADDIPSIVEFTTGGQELLRAIEQSPVPVVARVHGLALGGGVELALACHGIVCGPKAAFALPETGIGIYPGLGGTQRLPRIVGRPMARRLIFTGRPLSAHAAVSAGLALEVVPVQDLDDACAQWIEQGLPDRYARAAPAEPAIAEAYDDGSVQTILAGEAPRGLSDAAQAVLSKDLRAIGRKAPIALRLSAELLDASGRTSLTDGLGEEIARLPEIFGTQDALTGLRSVATRERPSWQGS